MNALAAAGWGALAAFSLVIGAWLALRYHPAPPLTGRIPGFGAGASMAAVTYGLVPSDGRYAEAYAGGAVPTMLANSMMPESFEPGGRLTGLRTELGFATAGAPSLPE